jgi:hypothetical protein
MTELRLVDEEVDILLVGAGFGAFAAINKYA